MPNVPDETVEIDGQSHDTWKVTSHGARKKTIWVSTSEPFAIKIQTKSSPGTWKLRPVDSPG